MSGTTTNVFALDSAYKPFPSFETWNEIAELDLTRWSRYQQSIEERKRSSPEFLERARSIATRAAAIDTGALEGLYETDRGFTYTVAFETAAWDVALAEKGEEVRSLFEAQLHAYDYVLDIATRSEPISEAAIRALHSVVCAPQKFYRVITAIGPQEQPLPIGQYKVLPNHVRTRNGDNHSYAPVDSTPSEMARIVRETRKEEFLAAHPVRQAAYVHYCFVVVHPFADGNGRVARALASAFTYRAISTPIIILSEQKVAYLDSLAAADAGDLSVFEAFMLERSLDTLKLVEDSLYSAGTRDSRTSLSELDQLYITKGGYTQDQVEEASQRLLKHVMDATGDRLRDLRSKSTRITTQLVHQGVQAKATISHRVPLKGNLSFTVSVTTPAPAAAAVSDSYVLLVPRDAGGDDDFLIYRDIAESPLSARTDELIPRISGILQLRITLFAERVVNDLLAALSDAAKKNLAR